MKFNTSIQPFQPPRTSGKSPIRPGFTLVELLVVIATVGVLMAVIIPTLQSTADQADTTQELAAARQLSQAYLAHATDNEGRLLTGYLSQDPADRDFEERYDVRGPDGTLLSGPEKRRWTWRLLPYLDDAVDSLFVNQGRDYIDRFRGDDEFAYIASVYPSFGLNAEWLGGMKGATYGDLHTLGKFTGECYYAQRLTDVQRQSEQLLFASSRGPELEGPEVVEGYFYLLSPHYHTTGWRWNIDESGDQLHETATDPLKNGFVSARHRNRVATTMLDGSTNLETLQDLSDMRRWAPDAWKSDWVLELQAP